MRTERFYGQTAVITGGGSGIGRAVARRLACEGARIEILDVSRAAIESAVADLQKLGTQADGAVVDVGDEEQVRATMTAVEARHGRIDVAIHCAGIVGPNGKRIVEVTAEEFDRVSRVNLRGAFLVTKYALVAMEKRGYGRILLFASIAGKEGNPGMCCYSATKAGVIGLVKSVGKEYATMGITVNAVAPAVIRTDLVAGMDPAQVTYMTDRIPMQRCGTLEEAAALACWIVSPEAAFNTGFTFDLSGGRATY